MPDKPLWLGRLPDAISQLESRPDDWVDRPTLESLLGIGRRRAQQLLAPIARRLGTSLVAVRSDVIAHLKRIAAREEAYYEARRQQRLWAHVSHARQAWIARPPVLVEVSNAQVRRVELHDLEGLPEGVELAPGSILVRFADPDEALRKLMALAMAISQNYQAFEERVRPAGSS
jgi:hypothetical protein